MRRAVAWLGGVLLAAMLLALPPAAQAQDAATLVADRVQVAANRQLIADGSVEVLHKGARLRARRIVYDRAAGTLDITGPMTLTDDAGTVVLADAAALSDDLRDGILKSARVVLERQMQIAAAEVRRLGGQQTLMSRAVASSCRVCETRETPLWEIRARRVMHDQIERQIHFDDAVLRMGGVPVLWFPYLRMPDPTLDRTTGFLMPRLVSNSRLGWGVHAPYFITLGRSRDLTLTPFLATKEVRSLGFRYREAFRRGELALTGAVGTDATRAGRRGWIAGEGRFDLGAGFGLRFAAEAVSDPAYLRDYGLSEKDRLQSDVVISRTRAGEHIGARLVHVHSIRAGEVNATLPQLSADLAWVRRVAVPGIGGTATLAFESHAHRRTSGLDGAAGRDVARASISAFWRRDWVGPAGVLLAVEGGADLDLHRVRQDRAWPRPVRTATPAAMIELRWPWARVDASGRSDVIEPVVQLVWSRATPTRHVPNEDSTLVEFDEGNLFGFSRFAGADRREGGARVNAGLQWTRTTPEGWHVAGSVGRVFRLSGPAQFSAASGLAGRRSDWLAALHMAGPQGTVFQGRAVFDDRLTLARGEFRLGLDRARYSLAAGWIYAEADPLENRPTDTAEWLLDGRLKLADGWTARGSARYDFDARRTTAAALGLEFANECLRMDVTLSRRFTTSATVRPTTDFGISIDFLGFGGARPSGPAGRACRY